MKQHHWLIIIVLSLLGMFFVPKAAYSAQFAERIPSVVIPAGPMIPAVTLPSLPLPFPSTIPGPAIQLPIPVIPVVAVPDRIQVVAFAAAPRQESKGVFTAAQKAFAAAPGSSAPSAQQLNTGFDTGASAKSAVHAGAVEIDDAPKPQPKKKKTVESSRVFQVPTWELEHEIGI